MQLAALVEAGKHLKITHNIETYLQIKKGMKLHPLFYLKSIKLYQTQASHTEGQLKKHL